MLRGGQYHLKSDKTYPRVQSRPGLLARKSIHLRYAFALKKFELAVHDKSSVAHLGRSRACRVELVEIGSDKTYE